MPENLNSYSNRTDEEIRTDNETKFNAKIQEEYVERQMFLKRQKDFGAKLYARLPITIEAYQWFIKMGQTPGLVPSKSGWAVQTHNGLVPVKEGDFIVQDIAGKYYPCNPEVFNSIYEVIE